MFAHSSGLLEKKAISNLSTYLISHLIINRLYHNHTKFCAAVEHPDHFDDDNHNIGHKFRMKLMFQKLQKLLPCVTNTNISSTTTTTTT